MKPFECMGNFVKASKGQTSNVTSWASPAWNPINSVPFSALFLNTTSQISQGLTHAKSCQYFNIPWVGPSGRYSEKFSEQVSCRLRQQSCSLKAKKSWGPFWCVETGERWHDRMAAANVLAPSRKYSTRGLDPKILQQIAPTAQLHVMQLTGYHEMLCRELGLPEVLWKQNANSMLPCWCFSWHIFHWIRCACHIFSPSGGWNGLHV